MSDNRTTELREKLMERGVDYEVKDLSNIKFFHDTRWNANGVHWCYTEFVGATTCLTMCNEWKDCTPEQAIAATLGSQRHVETCHITASSTDGLCSDNPRHYFELSCGHSFTINGLDAPVACAVCGKVVKNAD